MTTLAYQYGKVLRAVDDAIRTFVDEIGRGFRGERSRFALPPEVAAEAASERRYRIKIQMERQAGLDHVQKVARQVRRELGLLEGREVVR